MVIIHLLLILAFYSLHHSLIINSFDEIFFFSSEVHFFLSEWKDIQMFSYTYTWKNASFSLNIVIELLATLIFQNNNGKKIHFLLFTNIFVFSRVKSNYRITQEFSFLDQILITRANRSDSVLSWMPWLLPLHLSNQSHHMQFQDIAVSPQDFVERTICQLCFKPDICYLKIRKEILMNYKDCWKGSNLFSSGFA